MIDELYVREILEAAKKRGTMNAREFRAFCKRDLDAGYHLEVEEAARRLFGGPAAPKAEE